jgi:hypothetical protein
VGSLVELFTLNCHLSASSGFTLDDLELQGSSRRPLDIFVVVRNAKAANEDRPHEAWGFASSNRGIATFDTSLRMFLYEISQGRISLEKVLVVLWEVTHFPPCVIAFQQLSDCCPRLDSKLPPVPYAIFAACFRDTAFHVVPPWISSMPGILLQASRQIFAWLHTLSSSYDGAAKYTNQPVVHKVKLKEMLIGEDSNLQLFSYNNSVTLLSNGSAITVAASKQRDDDVSFGLLARAFKGNYEQPWNYYFSLPLTAKSAQDQRRAPLLHPAEFENQIKKTNDIEAFKIIGPLGLALSVPPLITLDQEGYVSIYDMKDIECAERYPITRNTINGEEVFKGTDPGHYLLQKLQPIILERKKEGTWDVDAWKEADITGDSRPPAEAIVVCVDLSYSMVVPMGAGWSEEMGTPSVELSRLDEAKDIFQNIVSRIAAYRLPTQMGLVVFSSRDNIRTQLAITPVIFDFKDILMTTKANGSTAMWDAVVKAKDMLVNFKQTNPKTPLRIILLTDGEDNDSRNKAADVCAKLYDHDIVLDTVVIGTNCTGDLFKVARHTGGYAFNPKTRPIMFQIPMLETFTDIRSRPDIVKIPIVNFVDSLPKPADMATAFDFPPCRPHQNQNDAFMALRNATRLARTVANRSVGSSITSRRPSSLASATSAP